MSPKHFLTLFYVLLMCAKHAHSADYFQANSINVVNNGPINGLFNLVRPDFEQTKALGAFSLSTQLEISNYISANQKQNERFFIDGETFVFRNTLRHQLTKNIIISTTIPWIKHSGGKTDSLIYKWHELFQLPQNGRRQDNEDNIRWLLIRNDQTLLDIENDLQGWGDMTLSLQLEPKNSPSLRWTFATKIPTGDYAKQTGSEAFDFGLAVTQMNPEWFKNRHYLSDTQLSLWYGAGLNYLGEIDELKALDQNPFAFTFRAGVAYAPFDSWYLKCQLDAQSPIYDTKIRELGWYPVLLSFASTHKLSDNTNFELGLVEDIRPRSGAGCNFSNTTNN